MGLESFVGSPSINPLPEGKDLFNSAYFLADGEILHVHHKTLLPTYDIFDEYRYFEPNQQFDIVEFRGKRIALTVCEDIWNVGNENPLYLTSPMDELIKQQPDFMINLSASPFSYRQAIEQLAILRANVARYKLPIFYVNNTGGQTELIFDGGSIVMNAAGKVFDELPYFTETIRYYDFDELVASEKTLTTDNEQPKDKIDIIHRALITGIRDYFGKTGFKRAILGMSGGVDSAVVAALAVEALGKENVRLVMMPSQYSSDHSVSDAQRMITTLGCEYDLIAIADIYNQYLTALEPQFAGTQFNVTEENIQARVRGTLLMALSNKFGYILLNTTNKSEAAVGYGTLYGDLCGGLAVLGDVYKTEVYQLADHLNRNGEIIPRHILTKAPWAELRPNQKDSDSLPDYSILDKLLYQYIELRKGPKELVEMGFDKPLVDRTLKLVNTNEFKRFQVPPILRVSPKAFGSGRRMPLEGRYLS